MSNNSYSRVYCKCGKTIQQRNYAQHCFSKHHMSFITKDALCEKNKSSSIDLICNITPYLRENGLRSSKTCIQTIIQKYENTDPYTKLKFQVDHNENIPINFHIDHIHETQILAAAIKPLPEFVPYDGNVLAIRPLRRIINDISNLVITEAFINRSKGQAIKYFLNHYETNQDLSLWTAFIQTASGKERSIACFSTNIVNLIKETSPKISNSIREIRIDNGHITSKYRYEIVAEHFDVITDRMKLDWNENSRLRNGKIYQAYR